MRMRSTSDDLSTQWPNVVITQLNPTQDHIYSHFNSRAGLPGILTASVAMWRPFLYLEQPSSLVKL